VLATLTAHASAPCMGTVPFRRHYGRTAHRHNALPSTRFTPLRMQHTVTQRNKSGIEKGRAATITTLSQLLRMAMVEPGETRSPPFGSSNFN
jgi:hypothetical protein